MSKLCPACGGIVNSGIGRGGVLLCQECYPVIVAEIENLRSKGKPVNVSHIAHRLYKEAHGGGDYLLRNVPEELWQKAKHRAIDDGVSLRGLILKALSTYLQ